MNSAIRHELIGKLNKCEKFAELKSNKSRVEYVLENIYSLDRFRTSVTENVANYKKKSGKSLAMAKSFKLEGDLYLQHASIGPLSDKQENIKSALKSYHRAILYCPTMEQPWLTAKLYARKCQAHLQQEDQNEAALYSIDTALDICYAYGKINNATISSKDSKNQSVQRINYMIVKVNILKMMERYSNALDVIDSILDGNMLPADWEHSKLIEMRTELVSLNERTNDGGGKAPPPPPEIKQSQQTTTWEPFGDDYFSYRIDPRCIIKHSPVVGRHFVAGEEIQELTVLLEEKPYSIIIEEEYLHKKCSNCYRDLDQKIFTCPNCIELLFCDRKCFESAKNIVHRYECGMMALLKSITSPSFHVFRMISRIGPKNAFETERNSYIGYSIDEYMKEPNQRLVPERNKTIPEKLRAYKMSSILWDHDSKHSTCANVHHTIIGIETVILLDLVHNFLKDKTTDWMLDFMDMVIVDTRRIIFNVFGWHEYNDDWSIRGHVANCQCLVGSLINHSCVPNTNWEFNQGQIKFTTNRLIKKGEEITITYGPNKDIPYPKRQERLNHYFFACRCSVCLDDAKKGNALKCMSCGGPVPFDVPLDNEPVLTGQCIVCFRKYPDFQANINEYRKCSNDLERLYNLLELKPDIILFSKAMDMAQRFSNLSITPNENVNRILMDFTKMVMICNDFANDKLKMTICQWIDQHLPIELESTDFYALENLMFWVNFLAEYIRDNHIEEEHGSWRILERFRKRINHILDRFGVGNSYLEGMIENINLMIKKKMDETTRRPSSMIQEVH